jgi:hypothetical protein
MRKPGTSKIEIPPELAEKVAGMRAEVREKGARLAAEGNTRRGEARRAAFVDEMRADPSASIDTLAHRIGISPNTYTLWRSRFPDFALAVDQVRLRDAGPWTGTTADFRMEFFGRRTFPHQQQMLDIIDNAPPRTAHLFLVPPEAGKTTTLEEVIAKKIALDPASRIQYWGKAPDEAEKRVARIKAILTDGGASRGADGQWGKIIRRFGPFYSKGQERSGRPWRRDGFTVWKAPLHERDQTLEAKGINAATQGTRADLIVVDDPQDLRNINDSAKIFKKIRQEAATRLTRNGVLLWIATRVDANDVYDLAFSMPEDEFFFESVTQIPALDGRSSPSTRAWRRSAWPPSWSPRSPRT